MSKAICICVVSYRRRLRSKCKIDHRFYGRIQKTKNQKSSSERAELKGERAPHLEEFVSKMAVRVGALGGKLWSD